MVSLHLIQPAPSIKKANKRNCVSSVPLWKSLILQRVKGTIFELALSGSPIHDWKDALKLSRWPDKSFFIQTFSLGPFSDPVLFFERRIRSAGLLIVIPGLFNTCV